MRRDKKITTIKKKPRGKNTPKKHNYRTQKYEVTRKQSKQIVAEKAKQC